MASKAEPKPSGKGSKAKEKKRLQKLQEQKIKESKQSVDEGLKFHDKGNYNTALKHYAQAITLNPDNCEAYAWQGRAHRELKEFDKAITDYTKAIELEPEDRGLLCTALLGRASSFECVGDFDAAIDDYTQVIEIDPDDDHAYNQRGNAHQNKRLPGLKLSSAEFQGILNDFSKAIELNPYSYSAYLNRGIALHDRKMFKEAIADFTKSIQIKHDYVYGFVRRGISYYESVLWEEKQSMLSEAEEKKLATVLGEVKENKLPKLTKDVVSTWENEFKDAEEAERKKRERQAYLENALADFTKAISIDENDSMIYKYRSRVHDILGNTKLAEEDRKK